MELRHVLRAEVLAAVSSPDGPAAPTAEETARITVIPALDSGGGPGSGPGLADAVTNAALVLARGGDPAGRAGYLAGRLTASPKVAAAWVDGRGHVAFRLHEAFWHDRLRVLLTACAAPAGRPAVPSDPPPGWTIADRSHGDPVFRTLHAHARARSVLRHAGHTWPDLDLGAAALAGAALGPLLNSAEQILLRRLVQQSELVENAAPSLEAPTIRFYLYDVASAFHELWVKGRDVAELRFVDVGDRASTVARLALVRAVAEVIASGLRVLGVAPVEEMQ